MGKPTKKELQGREEAITRLRGILKPGDTVLCNLRHVSRSGMLRIVDLFVVLDGDVVGIGVDADRVLRWGFDRKQWGIKVSGCGMDAGFHAVYTLAHYLFPDGFGEACREEGCTFRPSSREEAAHCNDNLPDHCTPHKFRGRNGDHSGWDDCGGYALKHRWI